tara:strand:- start:6455 stop:7861 length:1407 start_codon:yes stop_codon:yes gene_type:complete
MLRTAVINVVGLTNRLIGKYTPQIEAFRKAGATAVIEPPFPAVTCTAQSDYVTGVKPSAHGIVANGWYNREYAEVHFWKQPDQLVQHTKIWDELKQRNSDFTCAKLFWWYNMYSRVDWSVTPRPMYPADGRKLFDIYAWPYELRTELKGQLGEFPFFGFWGPAAGLDSPKGKAECVSRWIAESAKIVDEEKKPTLSLVYLPHLDYNLQRLGPNHSAISRDLELIDAIVGDLIRFYRQRSVQVILLSEYGITPVSNPIHLNRIFRERGWITVKEELGRELLDFGNSKIFAVADHQVAHIYLNDRSLRKDVLDVLKKVDGIDRVLAHTEMTAAGISHPRAGDLVAMAQENAWFTYYYWSDDSRAPDFASTVDIHRKPGYDPCELFVNPSLRAPKLRIMRRLLQKKLGFRMLMDVVPMDATLVKGSHGVRPAKEEDWPVLISQQHENIPDAKLDSTEVYGVIKSHVLTVAD